MTALAEGGCLCGRIRYRANTARAIAAVCHCRDCQRQSGSSFSILLLLPRDDLQLEGEALRSYTTTADSGGAVHRRFCGHCGSPVLTEADNLPGQLALKAGTLDDVTPLKPQLHLWCSSAQPWVELPKFLPCLPKQPKR